MGERLEISKGQTFGLLSYMAEAPIKRQPSGQRPRRVICRCDCGNIKEVLLLHLMRGRIKSCGKCRAYPKRGDEDYPIYRVWRGMKNRCKKNYFQRKYYYDKGIDVCILWKVSFRAFKAWALANGYKQGLQLDRRKNNHWYSPSNCRFVTQEVNLANRDVTFMVEYQGERRALTEICSRLGFDKKRRENTYRRIKLGWDIKRAIETPTRVGMYNYSS